jgi:hypothetical protein
MTQKRKVLPKCRQLGRTARGMVESELAYTWQGLVQRQKDVVSGSSSSSSSSKQVDACETWQLCKMIEIGQARISAYVQCTQTG